MNSNMYKTGQAGGKYVYYNRDIKWSDILVNYDIVNHCAADTGYLPPIVVFSRER